MWRSLRWAKDWQGLFKWYLELYYTFWTYLILWDLQLSFSFDYFSLSHKKLKIMQVGLFCHRHANFRHRYNCLLLKKVISNIIFYSPIDFKYFLFLGKFSLSLLTVHVYVYLCLHFRYSFELTVTSYWFFH